MAEDIEDVIGLSSAETKLIKHAISGELADFSGEQGEEQRTIRARVLRSLLLGLKLPPLDGVGEHKALEVRSIMARGPIILGLLNLVEAVGKEEHVLPPFILERAEFRGGEKGINIDARHARMIRLSLEYCTFSGIDLTNAKVGGDVDLSGVGPNEESGVCRILAHGCRVEGAFRANGAQLKVFAYLPLNRHPKCDMPWI